MADDLTGAIEQIGADIKALRYKSGQRLIPLENGATGLAYILRSDHEVELYIRDLVPGTGTLVTIPSGFRPVRIPLYGLLGRTGSRQLATFDIGPGHVLVQGTAHTSAMYLVAKWTTADPIPTTLPGSPA